MDNNIPNINLPPHFPEYSRSKFPIFCNLIKSNQWFVTFYLNEWSLIYRFTVVWILQKKKQIALGLRGLSPLKLVDHPCVMTFQHLSWQNNDKMCEWYQTIPKSLHFILKWSHFPVTFLTQVKALTQVTVWRENFLGGYFPLETQDWSHYLLQHCCVVLGAHISTLTRIFILL